MSTSYSGEKIINRQRVCGKCHGFVTHDKASDGHFACALCGFRIISSPNFSGPISVKDIRRLVTLQLEAKEKARDES